MAWKGYKVEDRFPEEWLNEFHYVMGEKTCAERYPEEEDAFLDLRAALISEECAEVLEALEEVRQGLHGALEHLAKELADLCVVSIGTADLLAIPFTPVFEEVMRSNLSKVAEDGTVLHRADGKILKPSTYHEADLSFVSE